MNYYQPRQLRGPDGQALPLWHYTCQNGARIWPVGACAISCPGHATADEAREHYRAWLIANADMDGMQVEPWGPCLVCQKRTPHVVALGPGRMDLYALCDEHRTREHLATVVELPGDTVSSW